jgi:hypothetical protein
MKMTFEKTRSELEEILEEISIMTKRCCENYHPPDTVYSVRMFLGKDIYKCLSKNGAITKDGKIIGMKNPVVYAITHE